MKLQVKLNQKKHNTKNRVIDKSKKEHVCIIAQEIKFARLLSGNEKKNRDRVLKTLKKWLASCFQKGYAFKEEDFERVWKGLFYAVWMSDKPLVQEELCDSIASILDLFPADQFQNAMKMTKAGLRILAKEWFGIDQHRMDKFMMLVRRFLRASLRCVQRSDWDVENCKTFAETLSGSDGILALKTPHYARNATSMILHYVDCFLEELSKVSRGAIPASSLVSLLVPFVQYSCAGECSTVLVRCRRLLTALLRQSSLGLQYQEATRAWHQMGCPEGGPEALELVVEENGDDDDLGQDSDEDPSEGPLDPRAGHVDVELNPLPVPAEEIAALLREQLRTASSKAYTRIKIFMQRFEKLAKNEYPLPLPSSDWSTDVGPKPNADKAAAKLIALEQKLKEESDELALRGLSRKHRKRILAKSRAGFNIADMLSTTIKKYQDETNAQTTNGNWQVEDAEPQTKKPKLEENNKLKENGDQEGKISTEVAQKKENRKDTKLKDVVSNSSEKKKGVKDTKNNEKQKDKRRTIEKNSSGKDHPKVKDIKSILHPHKKSKTHAKVNGDIKHAKDKSKAKESKGISDDKENNSKGVKRSKLQHKDKKDINKKESNQASSLKENHVNGVTGNGDGKDKKDTSDRKQLKNVSNAKGKFDLNKIIDQSINKAQLKDAKKDKVMQKEKVNGVKKYEKLTKVKKAEKPTLLVNKVKKFPKSSKADETKLITPKKVKFVLKNNSMQEPVEYYKRVRQSPNIPFNPSVKPSKTNLKPFLPTPINPFFKKKLRLT